MVFLGVEPALPTYIEACLASGYPRTGIQTRSGAPWLSWPALYRALASMEPDAIILHSVKAIVPAAFYARRHGVPLLAVEHQPNDLKSKSEWLVSRWLPRLADAVGVLTEDYLSTLKARLGPRWPAANVCLVPNGIDVGLFSPAPMPSQRDTIVIGMAARMTPMKRQDVLIDAMAILRNEDRRTNWRLNLAGDGESIAGLRERVEALGLQDLVDFPGYLGEAELLAWFRKVDIYAHASNGETLSTSLLQALAMGLPIVGSDVPGISDLLAKGGEDGAGLSVAQSPGAFAQAFRTLSADPGMAARLRSRARRLAEAEYSKQAMFERYDALIDRLCQK
jgi:glycosyltransferase involved in cell wall biosynthesis